MSDLQSKILLLTSLGFDAFKIAEELECSESYVRATVSREKKRMEMKAFQDAVAAMEMR